MAALAAALAVAASAQPARAEGPRLECRPDTLDYGTMMRGEKRTRTLHLRNSGDERLLIEQVRASCAECVPGKVPVEPLEPGAEFEMPVTFVAVDVPGEHTAYLTLHTNDPAEPLKRVYLKVTISEEEVEAPRLAAEPQRVDAGIVLSGRSVRREVRLKNAGTAPLRFSGIITSPGIRLEGEALTELAPGEERALALVVEPQAEGLMRGSLTLITSDPRQPVLTVPVEGYAASREEIERALSAVQVAPERDEEGVLQGVRVSNGESTAVAVQLPGAAGPSELAPGESVQVPVAPPPAGNISYAFAVQLLLRVKPQEGALSEGSQP